MVLADGNASSVRGFAKVSQEGGSCAIFLAD